MTEAAQDPGRIATGLGRAALALIAAALAGAAALYLLPRPRLFGAYLRLWQARWRRSPYRWDEGFETRLAAKRAGVERRALTFGVTPVFEAARLLRWAGVGPGARVFDAGAGRGHVLLAARRLGAQALGAELVRAHVQAAGPILEAVGATLRAQDAAEADLGGVTHVFCAWTLMPDVARRALEARWAALPAGARVITLSAPVQSADFEPCGARAVSVGWGFECAYLARRR